MPILRTRQRALIPVQRELLRVRGAMWELLKAVEKGYEIVRMHEVWHFPQQSDELFKEYVNTFLKIKQEASGYPKECVTPEQKELYVSEYLEHEGIELDPDNITHNPGLRSLAKLMLNSFWGKLRSFHSFTYCPFLTHSLTSLR